MASQLTRCAAARVINGGSTGTAFVVKDDRRWLLTARHCVVDSNRQVVQQVELEFPDPKSEAGTAVFHKATARVVHAGDGEDWAILEVDAKQGLPRWAKQLRLLHADLHLDHPWSTYGFPGPEPGETWKRGLPLSGRVTLRGVRPHLFADRLRGLVVGGVSGAPVVVEEHAVGLIIRADRDDRGVATTGSLYALPFTELAAPVGHLGIGREPAFCERTSSEVSRGKGLPDVARAVWELDLGDPIESIARVERLVALWLLLEQLPGALRVADEAALPRPEARSVVEFAACQWFSRSAALTLADRLLGRSQSRVVSVESDDLDLITRFVRRAGFEAVRSVIWHDGHIRLQWTPGQTCKELVAELATELLVKLGGGRFTATDAGRALASWASAAEPARTQQYEALVRDAATALVSWAEQRVNVRRPACVFVSLLEYTSDDAIEAVHGLFPELGIIVCGPARAGALPLSEGPSLAEARVQAQRFEDALKELATLHAMGGP